MPRIFTVAMVFTLATIVSVAARQSFSGRLSDSACGASHQAKAAGSLTDRQCLLLCIRALATYVLVDNDRQVIPITNQDAMGLPLYAGRPVRLTGESRGSAIFVTRVEAIPAHLHLGHVMTNWRDTPGSRGFLPVAADEARVAVLHARLAARATSLDEIRLHAGHVLHALDPEVEPKGPGAGYGVKRATAGAQQHLDFAVKAEGATAGLTEHAAHVSAWLAQVLQVVDEAVATAQRARASLDAAAAAAAAADLEKLARRISEEGLAQAEMRMTPLLEAEGLLGVPK